MSAVFVLSIGTILMEYTKASSELRQDDLLITLGIIAFVITLVVLFILSIKLETRIDERGIHYRFVPFIWNWQLIAVSQILSAEVIKYNPILHYGGWGYRISIIGKGRAINIRGNRGIFVIRKNGKKMMIGTQKPEEAGRTLQQLLSQDSD